MRNFYMLLDCLLCNMLFKILSRMVLLVFQHFTEKK